MSTRKTFDEIFEDKTKFGTKIKTNEYHTAGKHIIIDQGQEQIAGYTDREAGLFTDIPAIIFGDHTRVIKYVDEPFFLGADGVKVLRCKYVDANYKYLYYALKNARIPDTGYNRHFKWLKEVQIPYREAASQAEITQVLDGVAEIISKREQEVSAFNDLIKARFVEMFANTGPSWPLVTIGDICTDTRTGPFGSALHHDEFVNEGIFVLGIDNAVENKFSYNKMRYITEEKYQQLKRYTVYPGDVIITIMGTIGRSAVIPENMPLAINTKHLACLTPEYSKVGSVFLCSVFQMHPEIQRQLAGNAKGAIMDGLNLGIIKALKFQLPPIQIQKEFEAFFEQVDKSKVAVQKALDEAQLLFDSLMQKYFG